MNSGLLIFKNMFIPIHGMLAINDMFHINMNYSNILNYVIHKMDNVSVFVILEILGFCTKREQTQLL